MKIEFTGRQTGIPEELRRLAERKLQKVGKLLRAMTRAHVILAVDKHRQVAEVSVHSRHMDLAAVEVSANPRLSVAGAIDKLSARPSGSRPSGARGRAPPRRAVRPSRRRSETARRWRRAWSGPGGLRSSR